MVKNKTKIIEVNQKNIDEYPPVCFLNPENIGYKIKRDWLKKRFKEGLKIKQLYLGDTKKPTVFIEYVPGEYAWRSVDAKGFMFIHCIWTLGNKNKGKGYASQLVKEVIKDAKAKKMKGVAVVTSGGPFMAEKDLFLKNKFKMIDEVEMEKPLKKKYQLMVKKFGSAKKEKLPKFKDYKKQLKKLKGLNIIYTKQCPWVVRFVEEDMKKALKKKRINIKELKTAKQAQGAPSIYATLNLVNDGVLLADAYMSSRRFENILKKELKK